MSKTALYWAVFLAIALLYAVSDMPDEAEAYRLDQLTKQDAITQASKGLSK